MKSLTIPYIPALEMLDASSIIDVIATTPPPQYLDQANS